MSTPEASHMAESPCICFRMRRAARRITEFYDEMLAPAGISTTQYSLLANLGCMEGCCTGELARVTMHEKSTLVRTLQPLLQAGYIEDRSPESSRRRRLYLTAEGRRVLEAAIPLWKQAQREMHTRLGDSYEHLQGILRVFDAV